LRAEQSRNSPAFPSQSLEWGEGQSAEPRVPCPISTTRGREFGIAEIEVGCCDDDGGVWLTLDRVPFADQVTAGAQVADGVVIDDVPPIVPDERLVGQPGEVPVWGEEESLCRSRAPQDGVEASCSQFRGRYVRITSGCLVFTQIATRRRGDGEPPPGQHLVDVLRGTEVRQPHLLRLPSGKDEGQVVRGTWRLFTGRRNGCGITAVVHHQFGQGRRAGKPLGHILDRNGSPLRAQPYLWYRHRQRAFQFFAASPPFLEDGAVSLGPLRARTVESPRRDLAAECGQVVQLVLQSRITAAE
jgi:hypothetical protein